MSKEFEKAAVWSIIGTPGGFESITFGELPKGVNTEWANTITANVPLDDDGGVLIIKRFLISPGQVITWVGLYRRALEMHGMRGGAFCGAGVWLLNCVALGSALLDKLFALIEQVSALALDKDNNNRFTVRLSEIRSQFQFDDGLSWWVNDSLTEIDSDNEECGLQANKDVRAYLVSPHQGKLNSFLDWVQSEPEFSAYNSIIIRHSNLNRDSALNPNSGFNLLEAPEKIERDIIARRMRQSRQLLIDKSVLQEELQSFVEKVNQANNTIQNITELKDKAERKNQELQVKINDVWSENREIKGRNEVTLQDCGQLQKELSEIKARSEKWQEDYIQRITEYERKIVGFVNENANLKAEREDWKNKYEYRDELLAKEQANRKVIEQGLNEKYQNIFNQYNKKCVEFDNEKRIFTMVMGEVHNVYDAVQRINEQQGINEQGGIKSLFPKKGVMDSGAMGVPGNLGVVLDQLKNISLDVGKLSGLAHVDDKLRDVDKYLHEVLPTLQAQFEMLMKVHEASSLANTSAQVDVLQHGADGRILHEWEQFKKVILAEFKNFKQSIGSQNSRELAGEQKPAPIPLASGGGEINMGQSARPLLEKIDALKTTLNGKIEKLPLLVDIENVLDVKVENFRNSQKMFIDDVQAAISRGINESLAREKLSQQEQPLGGNHGEGGPPPSPLPLPGSEQNYWKRFAVGGLILVIVIYLGVVQNKSLFNSDSIATTASAQVATSEAQCEMNETRDFKFQYSGGIENPLTIDQVAEFIVEKGCKNTQSICWANWKVAVANQFQGKGVTETWGVRQITNDAQFVLKLPAGCVSTSEDKLILKQQQ